MAISAVAAAQSSSEDDSDDEMILMPQVLLAAYPIHLSLSSIYCEEGFLLHWNLRFRCDAIRTRDAHCQGVCESATLIRPVKISISSHFSIQIVSQQSFQKCLKYDVLHSL